jgi:hypothetical protein
LISESISLEAWWETRVDLGGWHLVPEGTKGPLSLREGELKIAVGTDAAFEGEVSAGIENHQSVIEFGG